jgi:hypothetical protein
LRHLARHGSGLGKHCGGTAALSGGRRLDFLGLEPESTPLPLLIFESRLVRGRIVEIMRIRLSIAVMWALSIAVAVTAARYFLNPVPFMQRGQTLALGRHPALVPLHIAGGIVAITLGLFQFMESLRKLRPRVHRAMGFAYLAAVLLGGAVGLWLSPDTPTFVAELMTDGKTMNLPLLGTIPAWTGYTPSITFSPSQFFPVEMGFATLAIFWPLVTIIAFVQARKRLFERHREWMIRSYALTFAAVSVRLIGLPLLFLTRNPVLAITLTLWSWILNLAVAEWLIHTFTGSR